MTSSEVSVTSTLNLWKSAKNSRFTITNRKNFWWPSLKVFSIDEISDTWRNDSWIYRKLIREYLSTNDVENEFSWFKPLKKLHSVEEWLRKYPENAPNSFCESKIDSKWICDILRSFRIQFWTYTSILSNFYFCFEFQDLSQARILNFNFF